MEESNATTEVSSRTDASVENSKSCGHDCSCGSNRDPSISMPVCFLVKEQAKSYIAIQELQKRLDIVENIQDDVIDAIIEFRNYLSDTKSYGSFSHLTPSSLTANRSPATIFSKLAVQKSSENNVPSALESAVEVPPSIAKTKSFSSKDCDHMFNELGRLNTNVTSQDQAQKNFDLMKSKEAVLESDKQDSGLDSDCREHNDIHPSMHKNVPSILCPESNDELLHLLDEINDRSAILQKQLAVSEDDVSPAGQLKGTPAASKSQSGARCNESKFRIPDTSNIGFMQSKNHFSKSSPAVITETRGPYDEHILPSSLRQSGNGLVGLFEAKPTSGKSSSVRKRAINSIDSTTVSSILKETNVVELQRQALIYLVDNAVLHTKLKEAEQKISSKNLENERVENSLKEETRLLMMENRELRLSLDEQRMESNSMKSRVLMLERALQSVTHENQELTWQLGESLNLQGLAKRGLHNYSSSFGCDSQANNSKSGRRASMPPRLPCQSEANVTCVKSKLLSNTSSFLDITVDDDADDVPPQATSGNVAFKCRNGPLHSSTPMPSSQKQKSFKLGMNALQEASASPVNFHSMKKCLKPGYDASSNNQRYSEEARSGQDICVKAMNVPRNVSTEISPLENVSFPFNTILEKLKSNSEYRLSRSTSTRNGATSTSGSDNLAPASANKFNKVSASQDGETYSQPKENKALQGGGPDMVLQRKKGRNIQQRIQNILDRIVAESEEGS